jgi:hypothetical protein
MREINTSKNRAIYISSISRSIVCDSIMYIYYIMTSLFLFLFIMMSDGCVDAHRTLNMRAKQSRAEQSEVKKGRAV